MKTTSIYETPTYHSFLQLPGKRTQSSRYSSMSKNPQTMHQSMKLPILSGTRSSFSIASERNMKHKLQQLGQKLQELQADIHNTRMDGNETLNNIHYIREELLDNQLRRQDQDMKKQLTGLRNLLAVTKTSHDNRSNNLRQNYIRLWNQTETMKEQVFSLTMRVDKLDEVMGMRNI